jgi:antitoxin (DNA-binding transcriptional repressor) of toxin-antitoxin stability system
MIKTIDIEDMPGIQVVIEMTQNGDEIVFEKDGEPVGKFSPIEKPREIKQRIAGLGEGKMWMSEDFDQELPDDFWGFDKEL